MTLHYNRTSEKEIRRELRQQQTPAERILWHYLRNRKLLGVKFRRQYSIDKYVIDFYCPELRLAVESDGSVHELPENKVNDAIRQKYLENYGAKFIRIKNEELLGNSEKAFARIEEEIKKRRLSIKKEI